LARSVLQTGGVGELAGATHELRRDTEAWLEARGLPSFVIRHGLSRLRPSAAAVVPTFPVLVLMGVTRALSLIVAFVILKVIIAVFTLLISRRFSMRPMARLVMFGRLIMLPMAHWTLVTTYRQLQGLVAFLIRALPLLLVFVTFLFLQNEIWQVMVELDPIIYRVILSAFIALTLLFAIIHL